MVGWWGQIFSCGLTQLKGACPQWKGIRALKDRGKGHLD